MLLLGTPCTIIVCFGLVVIRIDGWMGGEYLPSSRQQKRRSTIELRFDTSPVPQPPPPPIQDDDTTSNGGHHNDDDILDYFRPAAQCDATQMSGTHLAYIGDCVYELFVRSKLVWPPKKTVDLQQQAIGLVNAEYQSQLLTKLKQDYALTRAEQTILFRGRNATTKSSVHRRNPAAYQDSTAFEALLGYLFITNDSARLRSMLEWLETNVKVLPKPQSDES